MIEAELLIKVNDNEGTPNDVSREVYRKIMREYLNDNNPHIIIDVLNVNSVEWIDNEDEDDDDEEKEEGA